MISAVGFNPSWKGLLKGELFEGERIFLYELHGNKGDEYSVYSVSFSYPAALTCYPTYNLNGSKCTKIIQNTTSTPTTSTSNSQNATNTFYRDIAEKYLSLISVEGSAFIFPLSNIKAFPKFILVLTLSINDLVLYRYHRKFEPGYPNSTLIFMEKFDILRELSTKSIEKYVEFLNVSHVTFS